MKLNINSKSRFGSIGLRAVMVSALLATCTFANAQITYTWDGSAGDNSWINKDNWTPERAVPATNDYLLVTTSATINLDFAAQTEAIGTIRITNGAQATFRVASNKTLQINGNGSATSVDFYVDPVSKLTFSNSATDAALTLSLVTGGNLGRVDGVLEFNAANGQAAHKLIGGDTNSIRFVTGSQFTAASGFTGHAFGDQSAVKTIFQTGTWYVNESGDHPFGSGTAAAVNFQLGSNYVHRNSTSISLGGRVYGNIIIDYPGYVGSGSGTGTATLGSVIVDQASSVNLAHDGGTIIRGDITVNAGTLTINPASAVLQQILFRGTGVQLISAAGTGQVIFGNFCRAVVEEGYQVQLQTNIVVRNQMNIWGMLDAVDKIITSDVSTGTFVLVSGGTLYTKHPEGIRKTGAFGTVQVPGNRQYNTGTYRYYGSTAQVTGDGIPSTVNILTIENPAGVTLDKSVKVINQLNLSQGILTTASTKLITVDYTGVVSGESVTNFVNGPMAMVVANTNPDALGFPIGKGTDYRPVSLSLVHVDGTPTTYTAELMLGAPTARTLPTSLTMVSSTRYFSISKSPDAQLISGFITLPFSQDEGMGVMHPEAVRIAKSSGTTWVDLGGNYDANTLLIASSNSFTTFSDFVMARTSSVLPVSMISFSAAAQKENVQVNWVTATEENNDFFEVQRSADGTSFQTIGKVNGTGTTANRVNYDFTDVKPLNGLSYYRLRQVDMDGTSSFYGPVAVRINNGTISQLALYPNPAVQNATLSFEAETAQTATMRIVNTIGQTVVQKTVSASKGVNSFALPADQLQTGMYLVELVTDSGTSATRFVKQ